MDQSNPYMQAMISALMGAQTAAPGMGGQNPSTPYGAAFMTGGQMMPQNMIPGAQGQQQGQQGQPSSAYPGMLGQGAATLLQQPMATYS